MEEEQESPDLIVFHVNNFLRSIFDNIEVYINNRQNYHSNGLYVYKAFISNNFKGALSQYKSVLHFEGYDYVECLDEIVDALLSETFFSRRMKMLSRPDSFMLSGKLGIDFSKYVN